MKNKKLVEASLDEYIKIKAIKLSKLLLVFLLIGTIIVSFVYLGKHIVRDIEYIGCDKTREFLKKTAHYADFMCFADSGYPEINVGI